MSPLHTQRLSRSVQDVATLSLARTVRASFRGLNPQQNARRDPPPAGLLPLASQIKHALQAAFGRGEPAAVADFLESHPELTANPQVMLSLLFEEFCLLEQHGHAPDPSSFCARYEPWRDSLASQIRVHHELSRHVSLARELVVFPETGDEVLHYELLDELGEGGSARVFVARDTSLGGRLCALKLSMDRGAEAALQASLDHPHIISVHCVEHDDHWNLRALCMPYLPGMVLAQVIERLHARGTPRNADALRHVLLSDENRNAPDHRDPNRDETRGWASFPSGRPFVDGVAWLGLKLAEALHHAHGRGVFHRDIKPANILLTDRQGPMLFDFNLAHGQVQGHRVDAVATGGTLPYMAPEQLAAFLDHQRWADVTAPADVYSLGLVLRELLTGPAPAMPPVPASQTTQLIADLWAKRCTEPPEPVRSPAHRVPFALDAILARCLNPDISRRYASAGDLAEDLRAFLHHQPLRHARNPSRRERLENAMHRRRKAIFTGTGIVVAALVLVGAMLATIPITAMPTPARTGPEMALRLVEDASVHTRSGRLDEAIVGFQAAIQHDKTLYTPHMGLARIAFQREQFEQATSSYSQALVLMPANCRDDRIIALDCRGRSQFNLASQYQQQALQIHQRRSETESLPSSLQIQTPVADANVLMQRARDTYALARDDLTEALALAHQKAQPNPVLHDDPHGANSIRTADLAHRLIRALLGYGDSSSWFEDYQQSVTSYRQALQRAENLLEYLTTHLSPNSEFQDIPAQELPRLTRTQSDIHFLITVLHQRIEADAPMQDTLYTD